MTINSKSFFKFDPSRVPSPCFVVDEVAIENNLKILNHVQTASGAKVLLALKAFSMFSLASLVNKYLSGTCSSGLHEARLAHEEFGGKNSDQEIHVYSAAFKAADLTEILSFADHVVFNSLDQWQRFQPIINKAKDQRPGLNFGLRINPLHSEGTAEIYDPCAIGSRLGVPLSTIEDSNIDLSQFSGLHFHTLCEQGFDPLSRTLDAVESQFGKYLHQMKWVNFGGGHHITHSDYNVEALIARIKDFQNKYQVQVYLEPGEAIAINTGVLVSEVLDFGYNGMDVAILDCSATCHMPDTLEMPYRAEIITGNQTWAGEKERYPYHYRLGGQSCLAGDVMGDYSFEAPLQLGQRLMFDDMSHYTMVKTTTFNGIALPSIAIWNANDDSVRVIKQFDYRDFRNRLS